MTLDIAWPVKSREIVTPPCVSARWNDFSYRDDDIVIATWAKSGTTCCPLKSISCLSRQ